MSAFRLFSEECRRQVRVRGLSEVEIAEAVDEVRAHEAATGTPPEAEFGTAEEYAKQFPKQKRRMRGKTINTISTALAVAYVLLAATLMLVFRVDIRDFVGLLVCSVGNVKVRCRVDDPAPHLWILLLWGGPYGSRVVLVFDALRLVLVLCVGEAVEDRRVLGQHTG